MPPKRIPGYVATPRDLADDDLPTRIPSTPAALSPDSVALTERQLMSAKKRAARRDSFVAADSDADKAAVISATMREATAMISGGSTAEDFNEAALAFSDVLEMDPGNEEAKAGLRSALASSRKVRTSLKDEAPQQLQERPPGIGGALRLDLGLDTLLGATRRVQLTRKFTQLREVLTDSTNSPPAQQQPHQQHHQQHSIYSQHDDTAVAVGTYFASADPSWPSTAETSGMVHVNDGERLFTLPSFAIAPCSSQRFRALKLRRERRSCQIQSIRRLQHNSTERNSALG